MDPEQDNNADEAATPDPSGDGEAARDEGQEREKVTLRPVENYMPPVARREWRRAHREGSEEGRKLIGNYSAAFLLGVALVIITLVMGFLLARLYMRVENLESKVQKMEKRLPR